jgi:hypothetical protein
LRPSLAITTFCLRPECPQIAAPRKCRLLLKPQPFSPLSQPAHPSPQHRCLTLSPRSQTESCMVTHAAPRHTTNTMERGHRFEDALDCTT